jgi:streptogramin lyase
VTATVPVAAGRLFGVAAGAGSVWAVTDEALVRIDPATNRSVAKAPFPRAAPVGFTGVAVGEGAVWATNYDRGELYRVNPS